MYIFSCREERIALLDELGFEWKPRLPKKELVRGTFIRLYMYM